jgi:hypothetical protein
MRHPLRPAALLCAGIIAISGCERHPLESEALPPEAHLNRIAADEAEDGRLQDAESYTADFGVSVQEALRRMEIQEQVGELNGRLESLERATFAGLYLEHEPEFRVVARFTRDASATLGRYLAGTGLAAVVRPEPARHSLQQLQTRLEAANRATRGAGIRADGSLNVRENQAEIYVLPGRAAEARAAAQGRAQVIVVEHLAEPEHNTELHGGLHLSTCTSGFTVRNSSGARGISTSGHCGNTQSHNGYALTFRSERNGGSYDIQWHTRSGSTYPNHIWDGGKHRAITATRSRTNQSVGDYVCKYGKTTGYTCGNITTKSYCYDGACTWIRVAKAGVNLSEGGDSGGPWFNGGTAFGSHTLGMGDASAYMAINYISGISISVATN